MLLEEIILIREIAKELVFSNSTRTELYVLVDKAKTPVIDYYQSISEPFGEIGKLITYYEDVSTIPTLTFLLTKTY